MYSSVYGRRRVSREEHALSLSLEYGLRAVLANIGKTSTCRTERSWKERGKRGSSYCNAIMLAEGVGGVGAMSNDSKKV